MNSCHNRDKMAVQIEDESQMMVDCGEVIDFNYLPPKSQLEITLACEEEDPTRRRLLSLLVNIAFEEDPNKLSQLKEELRKHINGR